MATFGKGFAELLDKHAKDMYTQLMMKPPAVFDKITLPKSPPSVWCPDCYGMEKSSCKICLGAGLHPIPHTEFFQKPPLEEWEIE